MPLFDPGREAQLAPEDRIVIVHRFITRCRKWASEREIPKRTQRVAAGGDAHEAAKLHAWVAYRDFLDHTLGELEDGTLDPWFTDAPRDVDPPDDP